MKRRDTANSFRAEVFLVTGFSLSQLLKMTANRVTMLLLLVGVLAFFPILSLWQGETAQEESVSEETYDSLLSLLGYELSLEDSEESEEFLQFLVLLGYSQEETVSMLEELTLSSVSAEALSMSYAVSIRTASDYTDELKQNFETSFWLQYLYSLILLTTGVFSITYIVRSMIEEKASRLVETLLISLRPMALILGKLLGILCFLLVLFASLVMAGLLSYQLTTLCLTRPDLDALLSGLGVKLSSLSIQPVALLFLVPSLALGYSFCSVLGGVTGCSVSSTEEAEGATLSATLIFLAGDFGSTVLSAFDSYRISLVSSFFPVVSIFSAPVQYLLGNTSLLVLLMALGLQLVEILLLLAMATRLYDGLIFYRGSRLSLFSLGIRLLRRREGA